MNKTANVLRQLTATLTILTVISIAGFFLTRQAHSQISAPAGIAPNNPLVVSESGKQVLQIETEPVRLESLGETIKATGQVLFPSDKTVKISPRLQGRVRQVTVRVGDRVTIGQTLVVLDSVDAAAALTNARQSDNKKLQAAASLERQERLLVLGTPDATQAQASFDQAQARALSANDTLERTKEQARIGGFSEKPLEDAKSALIGANSDLAQAQSDLAQAMRDRERKEKLLEIGVGSKSDLESAENVMQKFNVSVQADHEKAELAKLSLEREKKARSANLYADQQVRSAESDYHQAVLQKEASSRALRLAKASIERDVQQARSDFQAAKADAENAHHVLDLLGHPNSDGSLCILSPLSGIVTERNVNPGQIVDQSQMTPWQMLTICNTDSVWIDSDVYEKDIASIAVGKSVRFKIAALPDREFAGVVRHIAPALDQKTRAIKVRVEMANPGGLLKEGMYAELTLLPDNNNRIRVVPLSAVQKEGESDYVYVVEGKKYVKRPVTLGAQRGGKCVVLKSLREGEIVVTHGALFLSAQEVGG